MAKYVPDIMSRRWVIISSNRADRPDELNTDHKEHVCPFCPGHEEISPEEVYRVGEGEKNTKGWQVRVIDNKFPITDYHEVIIHSPDHEKDLHEIPQEDAIKVFQTFRERYNFHRNTGQVMIFCNRGVRAGASLQHPHSQLVVIPAQINMDTLKKEPLNNLVEENNYFHIYCPDFSQWPYEVWLCPKEDETVFGDITDDQIKDLVEIYQHMMKRLSDVYEEEYKSEGGFSYNFYIHPKESWYIRIIPRFVHRAGFELGTGLSVNVTDPRDAARRLRGRQEEIQNLVNKLKELKKTQDEERVVKSGSRGGSTNEVESSS
jgi:UDPglucose--hexose-1-phosphate uridylyltransferase